MMSSVEVIGLVIGLFAAPVLGGCGTSEPAPGDDPPLPAGCNPLSGGPGEDCFLPFPSSFYTRADPGAATGLRVDIPGGVLPVSQGGKVLDPAPYNRRDGFSPATRLLAYFPALIDEARLPGPALVADSIKKDSPVQLLRYEDGERVPLFAELDKNALVANHDRQALLIQPVVRLREKTRYVVAISGLAGKDGAALPPLRGFAALRDGLAVSQQARAAERQRFGEIFAALERAGVPRQGLQLAWDFTTASDEPLTGRLLRMRDAAQGYAPPTDRLPPPAYTIKKVNDQPYDNIQKQILATFTVPSFLTDDVTGRLKLGPDGEPQIRDYGQFELVIHVPACISQAPKNTPLPVMIYGHGMFGGAKDEMSSGYQREIINRLCIMQVGTDWIGLAAADKLYVAQQVIGDFNQFAQLTERVQQAHVNVALLARLIKGGGLDGMPELQRDGAPLFDRQRLYYYGISDGGIQGATTLALTPDIERGCLNVPGGFWSMMMWRSADFRQWATLLAATYPDPVDRQVLVAFSQALWDYTDPATYAPHLLQDPLAGNTVKKLLYQEGVGDGQVPNLATRAMVRTLGLKLLREPVEPVFGVEQVAAPQDSAYVQFDVGQMPRPGADDVPPQDNSVHEAIRRLEAAKQQLGAFLREGGRVEDVCAGKPCYFPRQM